MTRRALLWEGRKMRHCVATYANAVARGRCSIWTVRKNGRRVLTVEVRNSTRAIVQVKGHCNRSPSDPERDVLDLWARTADLVAPKRRAR